MHYVIAMLAGLAAGSCCKARKNHARNATRSPRSPDRTARHRGLALALEFLCAGAFSLGAQALTGSGYSAANPLETVSPTLVSVAAASPRHLSATFSEPMLTPDATETGSYAISGAGMGTFTTHPDSVSGGGPYTLTWTAGEMLNGAALSVTATGLQDLAGNPINPARNSASGTGVGVAPAFSGLLARPSRAAVGETVTLSFATSEALQSAPVVTVNGRDANRVGGGTPTTFSYAYVIRSGDPLGMASVSVSGADLAGNLGALGDDTALEVIERQPGLALRSWPLLVAIAVVLTAALARRRRLGVPLIMVALVASTSAMADAPLVSNVTFSQEPTASGTQVDIRYDLAAPNGPCGITLSLSKNGGPDGYAYPITHCGGDVAGVTTGAGKRVVWDIRSDYPEETIPNARIRVTADDSVVLHTLTYTAGPGGSISGTASQTVREGSNGSPVTAKANPLYHFVQWSDGSTQNPRTDTNVTADISVNASFAATALVVTSFAIDGGAPTASSVTATLDNTCTNNPTHYMASESPDFSGAAWTAYGPSPSFNLSGALGARTVYFKVKNALGESLVVSDTIFLVPQMVSVAAGTFTMGRTSTGDDSEGALDEDPRHQVTLGAYRLGKYEVTNREFCDVLNWANSRGYLYGDDSGTSWQGSGKVYAGNASGARYPGFWCDISIDITYSDGVFSPKSRTGADSVAYSMAKNPVVHVTWFGAVAFCNWLSEWQGLSKCYDMSTANWPLVIAPPNSGGYRLPTEAEWERAAAWDGTKHWVYSFKCDTNYGAGSNTRCNDYCFNGSSYAYVNPLGLTAVRTSPVGWFNGVNVSPNGGVQTVDSPSPVGAYDMSGNVQEWVQDWFSYYSDGATTNPTGPTSGISRVFRGGSWYIAYYVSRSATRGGDYPANVDYGVGFRLAKS